MTNQEQPQERKCGQCGRPTTGRKTWCSNACKQKAYRERCRRLDQRKDGEPCSMTGETVAGMIG